MCIRTDGDDFAAKLTVAADHVGAGIGLSQTVVQAAGVHLNTDMLPDQSEQNLIQDIPVFLIRIIFVFVWTISDNVINVSIDIHSVKSRKIFQNG